MQVDANMERTKCQVKTEGSFHETKFQNKNNQMPENGPNKDKEKWHEKRTNLFQICFKTLPLWQFQSGSVFLLLTYWSPNFL